jgi:hypothetical protein
MARAITPSVEREVGGLCIYSRVALGDPLVSSLLGDEELDRGGGVGEALGTLSKEKSIGWWLWKGERYPGL